MRAEFVRWVPRGIVAAIVAVACVRAATAPLPPDSAPMDPKVALQAWQEIVGEEPRARLEAARKFPGEPWSADDDFHEREHKTVRRFAGWHETRIGDVVRAVDDGMHEHWPAAATPNPSVPPCRPRLTY